MNYIGFQNVKENIPIKILLVLNMVKIVNIQMKKYGKQKQTKNIL